MKLSGLFLKILKTFVAFKIWISHQNRVLIFFTFITFIAFDTFDSFTALVAFLCKHVRHCDLFLGTALNFESEILMIILVVLNISTIIHLSCM